MNYFKELSVKEESKFTHKLRLFVEKNHYLGIRKSLNAEHLFTLWHEDLLLGVAIFGMPVSAKALANGQIELRRFCLLNDLPKNTASFFLSKCLVKLRSSKYSTVVSYADPKEGHKGIIYKASNFKYAPLKTYNRLLKYKGRLISSRQVYQKRKDGTYYPAALRYQMAHRQGIAKYVAVKPKLRFTFSLKV